MILLEYQQTHLITFYNGRSAVEFKAIPVSLSGRPPFNIIMTVWNVKTDRDISIKVGPGWKLGSIGIYTSNYYRKFSFRFPKENIL